jgi:hypothetical protein
MPDAHGDSPVSHGTVRVLFGDLKEYLLAFFVPERVQEGDATSERLLHRLRTRDWEVDGTELIFGEVFVVVFFVVGDGCKGEQANEY